MLHKFRRHPDAVVLDDKDVISVSPAVGAFLNDPKAHRSPGGSIFYRVADQVYKHLVQLERICEYILIRDIVGVDKQFQLLGLDLRLDDIDQVVHHLGNIALLLLDLHFAALDPAHVQDIVDQAEQVVAG